ncbi:MAG: T9SS type A sorting domain-containing protein [Chloroherpetonaceae bacterium]
MKNSRLSKLFAVAIVVLTLFAITSSSVLSATALPPKKWHYTESALGNSVDVWITISDQNGDGVYDRWDLWAKYKTPFGGGIWEKGGDFSFRDPNGEGGYFNGDQSLNPGELDYISAMRFTPPNEYENPTGYRIEFRDITTQELTGVFEQLPGEPMPLYTSYKVSQPQPSGFTSVWLDVADFTKIYPNPANEQIKIHFGLDETAGKLWQDYFNSLTFDYLKIYNIEGKVIYEKKDIATQDEITVDTKSLPVGTYSVEISTDGIKGSMIFVISR